MEGHLQVQAVSAARGISYASGITWFLGFGVVTGGGRQLTKQALVVSTGGRGTDKVVCVFVCLCDVFTLFLAPG